MSNKALAGLTLDMPFDGGRVPRTTQQLTYEVLRSAILRGDLPAGTRLAQADLATQLSVSTTPVREALRRLASEDLVRIDTHRGAIVRGVDKDDLREMYEIRLLLEPLAMRKATSRIADEGITRAEQYWERMNTVVTPGQWAEDNRAFHSVFADAANSPKLIQILNGLRDSSATYIRWLVVTDPELPVRANREHRDLLDAVRARDPDRAAQVEEAHLRSTFNAMLNDFPGSGQTD
ncbi:GntR family transcriptional regulator [Georgenia halophila]|uniref:GntR family transcriptional regulator n=1 Tax=Georgenia halophila TaxID=620889 RepID=A0ABP8LDG8_9MICO